VGGTDQMGANNCETASACLMGVIFPTVFPWRYVLENFVTKSGARWRWREPEGAATGD
jgi:hypothetical protein